MSERVYCCEQNPDEPMTGTADVVDVWVMLEYRPVWKAKAITDNDLSEGVREWLARELESLRSQGLKVRPQFIRQPEIDRPDTRLLVATEGEMRCLSSEGYVDLLDVQLDALLRGTVGERIDEPHYFVCTNGQRDLCCSRFGLPTYRALRERHGDRVWQTTHLGGHRFAPNVLALPQGVLYGRVQPEQVDDFLTSVEAGRVAFPWLRGRSSYPKHVQAVEGELGTSDYAWEADRSTEGSVAFSRDGETRNFAVRADTTREVLASCGDTQMKVVPEIRIEALD